ncbi:MAG: hypothetical protein GX902_00740 [Lentisphaerae bacterium]|nr:hypothetical protein [Lentisphaerota bacterium]
MHDWAEKLIAIQELDIRIAKISEQLSQIPVKQQEAESLYAQQNRDYEQSKLQLRELEVGYKNLENEIVSQKEKKRTFQSKTILIKNNDEYKAALLQIEMCDQVVHNLEDQQLELMFKIEEAQASVASQRQALEQAQKRTASVKEDLEVLRKTCEEQIALIKRKREAAAPDTDPELLKKYEHLRNSRNNNPSQPCVIPILDGVCSRCRIRMTPQTCQDVLKGKIVLCPSCSGMLYCE